MKGWQERPGKASGRGLVVTCDVSKRARKVRTKRDQIDDQLKKVIIPVVSASVFADRPIEDFQNTVKDLFLNLG